jgi:hypothetical protein
MSRDPRTITGGGMNAVGGGRVKLNVEGDGRVVVVARVDGVSSGLVNANTASASVAAMTPTPLSR